MRLATLTATWWKYDPPLFMLFCVTPVNSGKGRSRFETEIVEPLILVFGSSPANGLGTTAPSALMVTLSRTADRLRYSAGSDPKL